MSVTTFVENPKKITVEELFKMELEEGYFYELFNGVVTKKKAPSPQHQMTLGNLITFMNLYIRSKRLGK